MLTKFKGTFAMFYKYRFLLQNLIQRDIKVKYRRSTLGILWSVLNPLLMMLVMTLVFSHFFRFDIENYPVYLLSGQLLFTYFTEGTSMAMESVIGYAPLIKKVYVPKYIFPLEKSCFAFIGQFQGEVPGASANDCGNYLDMNLPMANYWGKKYAALLDLADDRCLIYPE